MMVVPKAKSIDFISSLICLLYLPSVVLVGSCLLTSGGPADTGCSGGSGEEPQLLLVQQLDTSWATRQSHMSPSSFISQTGVGTATATAVCPLLCDVPCSMDHVCPRGCHCSCQATFGAPAVFQSGSPPSLTALGLHGAVPGLALSRCSFASIG